MAQDTPDTLPAGFNNWDAGPPDTLPAGFTGWDKPKQAKLTPAQTQAAQQIEQLTTTPSSAQLPRVAGAVPPLGIGAPPPFRGVPGAQPRAVPITQPAQNVLAQQGLGELAPQPPAKPQPFELGTTQVRPFTPAEEPGLDEWINAIGGETPELYHGQREAAAREQAASEANPLGYAMGAGEDIYGSEKSKITAGGREFASGVGQLGEGDIVHGIPRLAGGTFKMADPALAVAYIANPVAAAGGLVGGTLGSEALGATAQALHASPETEDWARLMGAVGGGFYGGVKAGSMELETNMLRTVTKDYIERGETPAAAAQYAQRDVTNFMASGKGEYIGMPGYRMSPLLSFGRKVTGGVLGGLRAVVPFTGERPEEQAGVQPRIGPMGEAGYTPPGPPTMPVLNEIRKDPSLFRTVAGVLMPQTFATPEQLATQAFRPRNAKSNWRDEIASALPDMKRGAQSLGLDENNMTLSDALSTAETGQQSVWQEYRQNFLDPMGEREQSVQSVADAIRGTITPRMREQNPGLVTKISRIADTYENRTLNVEQLQQRVSELNNETRAIEAKYVTDKASAKNAPANAYKFAERDTLRSLLDTAMDSYGPEAAALRRRYGALTSVRDVISRRIPVADRGSSMPLGRALALTAAAAQMTAGIVTMNPHMLVTGAATIGTEAYLRRITSPDYLTMGAFRKTEARPPWQILPQQGELPYPPIDLFGIHQTPAPPQIPRGQTALPGGQYEMPPSSTERPPGAQLALPPAQGIQLPPSSLPPQQALPPAPARPQLPGEGPPQLRPQLTPGAEPPVTTAPSRLLGFNPMRLPESISGPREAEEAAAARGTNLPRFANLGQPKTPETAPDEPLFNQRLREGHAGAVSSMLLDASAPPETADWEVVRPGKGLPNAIRLNDAARELIGNAMGARFGGVSVSPEVLSQEILPRLEMAAQTIDNTRAKRPDFFDPQAASRVRELARAIQENSGPEGMSFVRSEGTPEQQRYTTHEELFHTTVQRRPSGGAGLTVPDLADDPGMEKMRPRIIDETGRLTSLLHHAEGMADIMQGRAPELTPEEAGATAENYWDQLAARGKSGVQALVDAFKLENFMDDHERANGYTVDDATNAIRTAGRDALARVLSRQYGENLRGLAREVQAGSTSAGVAGAEGRAGEAGAIPPSGGEANLGPPSQTAAGAGRSPAPEVAAPEQGSLFSPDTEGNLRRQQNRAEGIGDPRQDRAVEFTRDDGKPFYVGRMTPGQWMDKVQSYLRPNEMSEWRNWYSDVSKIFLDNAKGNREQAERDMMGWLLTQQRASPAVGYSNLQRAKDIMSGLPEIKKPGLGAAKIFSVLRGETPEEGLGAKLWDFVDSAMGKNTRTWMGDDPRGGSPAVIDVHGGRDAGFIDKPMLNAIEKQFGPEAAAHFQVDMKGAPSETQYENGSQYYNDLANKLNGRNFDGGGWTPEQVQAVGWAAQQRMTGREPQLVKDIFPPSRRTISSELAFGEGSPYEQQFGAAWKKLPYEKQQAITQQVMDKIIDIASREAGGRVIQRYSGPGGYKEYPVAPSMHAILEGSPEAAQRMADTIGYLAQQTEVMASRPMKSGKNGAYQILQTQGDSLRSPENSQAFWDHFRNTLQEYAPKLAKRVQGFMPVEVEGQPGMRIIASKGRFSDADFGQLELAAHLASQNAKIWTEGKSFNVQSETAKHDWTADPTGGAYLQRLGETGRPDIQRRLAHSSAEVRAEIQRAFQKHAPETGVAPPPASSPSSPPVVPKFLQPPGAMPRPPT